MRLADGRQLGYCTNVHPYTDAAGLIAALDTGAGPLRRRLVAAGALAQDAPLGVGLWLPAAVAAVLADDASPLAAALERHRLHAFTVNAFPFGDFHGARVKDDVFRPSWAEPARLDHTLVAAQVLAALLPEGATGSLSTHTGGCKLWGADAPSHDAVAAGLLAAADGLAALHARTGRRIVLALEPEPYSTLETTDEVVEFFTRHLQPGGEAAARHLGLCFDACHQAVEHEDMDASLDALAAAGVPIAKVQLSSAIRLPDPGRDRALLAPFAEDRWLHQVIARAPDGTLQRWPDLPSALADPVAAAAGEWRCHFHVPLFAPDLDGEGKLATTRPDLRRLIAALARRPDIAHLEIETYSFAMIPAARRAALGALDLLDGLEREFRWVLGEWGASEA